MTVTFNRVSLITVANRALRAHDEARTAHHDAVEDWKFERAETHRREHVDQIRGLRDHLTTALKSNGLVTRDNARKAAGGINDIEYLFYQPPNDYDVSREAPKVTGLLSPAEISEIRALTAVLITATGDTITTNELKMLGMKNLAPVFIAAAAEPAAPIKAKR